MSILSIAFLNRILKIREWFGIWLVIMGLTIVGATDFFFSNTSTYSKNSVLTGDLLIITAQIITAIQMVYEEKYIKDRDIPALQAVGWEGNNKYLILFHSVHFRYKICNCFLQDFLALLCYSLYKYHSITLKLDHLLIKMPMDRWKTYLMLLHKL